MRCWLAGWLILLLAVVAGAETPAPVGERLPDTAGKLEQTLALLERVDPQTLPADQRRALYLAVADALLDAGQQDRALIFLTRAGQNPLVDTTVADEQLLARLRKISSPLLAAALQAGTPLAPLLRTELGRRGAPAFPAGPKTRTIGVLLPLSGRLAPLGEDVRRGMELALADQSSLQAAFVYRDTAGDIEIVPLLTELAADPALLGVIGPLTNNEALPAASQAEQERLPLLLLAPREGRTGSHVFRNSLTLAAQTEALVTYARGEGSQRFAIFHPATRHGESAAGLFQAAVERQGGRLVVRQSYPAGTINLREHLQELAAAIRRAGSGQPEALFLPDDARQVAQLIPQLPFARLDLVQLLGTSDWNVPELGRLAGPLSEGAVFVDGFFAASSRPEVRDFVARYQAAHGSPPNILAAQGYDAARIMLSLLARPEVHDRETLRQALATLRDFPGVTGTTRFGADGEAEKHLFLLQIQDGVAVEISANTGGL